jgi:signal transduction histidine kinase
MGFIINELIVNIIKHAKATKCDIGIKLENGFCKFEVTENGLGFDKNNVKRGLGLNSIEQRINDLGGEMLFNSHEDSFTVIGQFKYSN